VAAGSAEDRGQPDPSDTRLAPDITPPPESRFERNSSRAALFCFVLWGIVLAIFWIFPESWHAAVRVLDVPLWPLIRALGRPGAVAVVAAATAILSMLAQLFLTDTPRLRAVKRCAHILRRQQRDLPVHSPREEVLHAAVTRSHWRIARAGFVPLGILLGPMIASFLWLPARVDPANINPAPGAAVTLSAQIDGNYTGPVVLSAAGLTCAPQDETPGPTLAWPIVLPAGMDAVHRYTLAAQSTSVLLDVPTGDAAPPPLHPQRHPNGFSIQLPGAGPIKYITLTCADPRSRDQRTFWRPFAWAGWHWDAGWLGLYFVAYLPVMWLSRRVLRVP
jgi:uncharacterized membrane protein (DUF106 family)